MWHMRSEVAAWPGAGSIPGIIGEEEIRNKIYFHEKNYHFIKLNSRSLLILRRRRVSLRLSNVKLQKSVSNSYQDF